MHENIDLTYCTNSVMVSDTEHDEHKNRHQNLFFSALLNYFRFYRLSSHSIYQIQSIANIFKLINNLFVDRPITLMV